MEHLEKHLGDDIEISDEELFLHAVPYAEGSPGIVISEARAKEKDCKYSVVDGTEIVWCKGVIGALSPVQKELYFDKDKAIKITRPSLTERIKKFKAAVAEAKKEYEKAGRPGITEWLKLTGKEFREKGIVV